MENEKIKLTSLSGSNDWFPLKGKWAVNIIWEWYRCHDVASLNYASLNYPSLEKLDEASMGLCVLGLCVPRTFCPRPFCDNMSQFFRDGPSIPILKIWNFHPRDASSQGRIIQGRIVQGHGRVRVRVMAPCLIRTKIHKKHDLWFEPFHIGQSIKQG
jgi:hypothetical protein